MIKNVRIKAAILLSFVVAVAMLGIMPAVAEAAPVGFPLYSWGNNNQGQLGLGDSGAANHRNTPQRVGLQSNWVQVASGGSTSIALNTNGEIFAWGAGWSAAQMGQGGVNPGVGSPLTAPVRVGTANNWVQVSARSSTAAALNSNGELFIWGLDVGLGANAPTHVAPSMTWKNFALMETAVFAVSEDGYLYSWGTKGNSTGVLGQGHNSSQTTPARVNSNRTDWATIITGQLHVLAITEGGELYAWGQNANGQLGLGHSTSQNSPQRVGAASNWVTAGATTGHASAAINSYGELWTWGNTATGQLGRPSGGAAPANLPGRVGTGTDWMFVASANNHFLAATEENRLYSWGNNPYGQLGIGEFGGYRNQPAFILQSYGFADTARGGGQRSFMLMHTDPLDLELHIAKRLQMPEGTLLPPEGKTFTFNFVRYSLNGNTALANQMPQIGNNGEVTITVTNSSPSTTASGITARTESLEVLSGIPFGAAGVFVWKVTEESESSDTNTIPPGLSNMVYSQAHYKLTIWITQEAVGQPFEIYTVEIVPLVIDNPSQEEGVKTDDLVFTNTYTRITQGALTLSKTVVGQFANRSTPFDFAVTITGTAFCADNIDFVGRVYDAANNLVGTPIDFPSGTSVSVKLLHGYRLEFDEFLAGTRFSVVEQAAADFIASVDLVVNGSAVTVSPNTTQNTAFDIGTHIAGSNENSAEFINTHVEIPIAGMNINNPLIGTLLIAMALFTILLVSKRRKALK
ncbi:MAG: hypothetical protein FWE48_04670 [Coriobacteriia bacterium]|nr:hypothetical protein [Coriobacteriia bacterium]